MALPPITHIRGRAVTVAGHDIDTDRIIPARFMKCVTFDGLGEYAFYDERFDPATGEPRAHPLNDPRHAGASILISGANFGCGSSREHAPQSLYRFGIRAVLAESFAEIFFSNSNQLGMPCLMADRADLTKLGAAVAADPALAVEIDVAALLVRFGDQSIPVRLAAGPKHALVEGRWDPIADLLEGLPAAETVGSKLEYVSATASR